MPQSTFDLSNYNLTNTVIPIICAGLTALALQLTKGAVPIPTDLQWSIPIVTAMIGQLCIGLDTKPPVPAPQIGTASSANIVSFRQQIASLKAPA